MRVLYVCHRVPFPPRRGGKIRPFNMIRHLTEAGHEVTVASIARSEAEKLEAKDLERHCARTIVEVIGATTSLLRMLLNALSSVPSSFGYFCSSRLAQRILTELSERSYDLIFVHCSSVAPYVAEVRGISKILDFGDMDSQKWRDYSRERWLPMSLVYWLEAVKLEHMERRLSREFDFCTCTTRGELASLKKLGIDTPSGWFPNGVDTKYFAPTQAPVPGEIAFIGRMDYYPNQQAVLWFCAEVWPHLRDRHPNLHFLIVGADPPGRIRNLSRIPGITVTGSVEDVRPFVQRAMLTVAPLFIARGTQNKLLESMAAGTPVICSTLAAGGVDALPGEHLLVADGAREWVDAVDELLRSPERRMELSRAARERVESHHSWSASLRRMEDFISDVVAKRLS